MNPDNTAPWYQSLLSNWGFPSIVTALCLVTIILFVHDPIDERPLGPSGTAGAGQTVSPAMAVQNDTGDRRTFQTVFSLAAGSVLLWGAFAFTGDPFTRRCEQVKFAYFFVAASFAVFAIPPLVKGQAIGNEPLGIISGCIMDPKAAEPLKCTPPPEAGKPVVVPFRLNNQWLVNIGGTLARQIANPASERCANNPAARCKIGSPDNRAEVTGGLVVPLPFVIIALIGGAISLSRRVPEIQKCSEPSYIGTEAQPRLQPSEVRERLIFQILQFVSAPLIAIVAYQVIGPESDASSAGLAFMSGFGSETILLMVRGVVDGITLKVAAARRPAAAVAGVVREAEVPGANDDMTAARPTVLKPTPDRGLS